MLKAQEKEKMQSIMRSEDDYRPNTRKQIIQGD